MMRNVSITALLLVALAWLGVVGAASLPSCGQAPQERGNLTQVVTQTAHVPYPPFGIVFATQQPNVAFVAMGRVLGVLAISASAPPQLMHTINLPAITEAALGVALSHSGLYLLVTLDGASVAIVDTAKAAAGDQTAVITTIQVPSGHGSGVVEITMTPDDKYAFVSQEYGPTQGASGSINVFSLSLPNPVTGTVGSRFVGYIALDQAVVGSALSPGGTWLYAASEAKQGDGATGTISVLSVAKLMSDPSAALVAQAPAGCNPTRIIVSTAGGYVWVTARASNALLAFDGESLAKRQPALRSSIQLGTAPDSLTFFRGQSRMLIANSNRFNATNGVAGLGLVSVGAALGGTPSAYYGQVATGYFPREFAINPQGNLALVSVYDSREVQQVDLTTIP